MTQSGMIQRAFARRGGGATGPCPRRRARALPAILVPAIRSCSSARAWPADAQDLTQGFFLHLLHNPALKQAHPLKGKYRSFLLASFQNFLSDEASRARCQKRGGGREFVFLDS